MQLVGDDLFVTNPAIIQQGIQKALANAVLVKVNQIGTLTETLRGHRARQARGRTARSSRTARARRKTPSWPTSPWRVNAGQIKTGSLARGERTAKYNQLLRIEEELGTPPSWPGRSLSARGGR